MRSRIRLGFEGRQQHCFTEGGEKAAFFHLSAPRLGGSLNRLVRQVAPQPSEEDSRSFRSLVNAPNLVLLGDPGAGKTSLFRAEAQACGGKYLTVRSFLNQPDGVLKGTKALFLDALDEKRSGRSDSTTVDSLVQKLLVLQPEQVRISCRAADWLGDTDLRALNDYFDITGGVVVVALDALTLEEQREVLIANGTSDADAFIEEANRRGLEELLGNPQNLIMLFQSVKGSDWPSSKLELFERSCFLLLSEHNVEHAEKQGGQYSPEELVNAAGGLMAIRLIGDAAGISTSPFPAGPDCPSYRQLPVDDLDRVRTCLSRRIFVRADVPNTFDYAHRTIAEYLAARWLAKRVGEGLSVTRLLSLVGLNWKPASELRGLYAWLPVLLPEAASFLIDGDPFGALAYGDPASLKSSDRKHLLGALAKLAEKDPWFRKGHWRDTVAWGLSGPDLVPQFGVILKDDGAGFSLRSLVLDAISLGAPLPGLSATLELLALNKKRPVSERESAATVLCRWHPESSRRLFGELERSPDGLRIKTRMLAVDSAQWAKPHDYAAVLNEVLRLPSRGSPIGSYWSLPDSVPSSDISTVLNAIRVPRRTRSNDGGRAEGTGIVERLITRAVPKQRAEDASVLLQWLLALLKLVERNGSISAKKLESALRANGHVQEALAVAIVKYVDACGEKDAGASWRARRATLGCIAEHALLEHGLLALEKETCHRPVAILELVVSAAVRVDELATVQLDRIIDVAQSHGALLAAWNSRRSEVIPDWRWEESAREERNAESREADERKRYADFDSMVDSIRNGEHVAWITWIGKVYCGRNTAFQGASPKERMQAALGASRVETAQEGLRAFALRERCTVDVVLSLNAKSMYRPSWYAVVAGLDLAISSEADCQQIPVEHICAAVAIDVLRRVAINRITSGRPSNGSGGGYSNATSRG